MLYLRLKILFFGACICHNKMASCLLTFALQNKSKTLCNCLKKAERTFFVKAKCF